MNDLDSVEARCQNALWRIHLQIDAQGEKALRVIRSMAQRDRRAIGQLTRTDHIFRRVNRVN